MTIKNIYSLSVKIATFFNIISTLYNEVTGMTPGHLFDILVNASYFDLWVICTDFYDDKIYIAPKPPASTPIQDRWPQEPGMS